MSVRLASEVLVNGPPWNGEASRVLVLAHGAGAPMDTPFMTTFAEGLAARVLGLRVVRFEFPYMAARRTDAKKRPPDRQAKLLDHWRAVIDALAPAAEDRARLVIGGKSMGGRMATLIAAEMENEEAPVGGVVVLGYPFHPAGKPDKLRTDHLHDLRTPTLICQGTRDPLGTASEVMRYTLSDAITLHWALDGDHNFAPQKRSGRTLDQNYDGAIEAIGEFLTQR